jgi:hypothetical protein
MKRATLLTLAAASCVAVTSRANAQNPQTGLAKPAGLSALQGVVIDSLHETPLARARVMVEGTSRAATTDADGRYHVDSIPSGLHRISIMHPLLDTLGITMRTPEYNFVAGTTHDLDVPVPAGRFIASRVCTAAQQGLGPAVLMGFVKDPDSGIPVVGAKVELVYDASDPIGRKSPRVRSATTDSAGLYRICGLPKDMSGKVQVFRTGVSSGEVATEITNGWIGLRAFSIVGAHQNVVEVKGDSGKVKRVARGSAKVTGKVVDKKGQPLRDARVTIQGGGAPVLTNANGVFTLDSLPSGTQALQVRKLGYSVAEVPVELSVNTPASATVTMTDAVPLLETMRVEAEADRVLSDLGFTSRKQTGMGYFMEGNAINHAAMTFSDVMRVAPGLRISPTGNGRDYVIQDSRNAQGGCVTFYVDGVEWQTMTPGDIDQYVRPDELVAVEVYHGSNTPPQFQKAGQSSCASIVAWTQAKVSTMAKKKKK